MNLPVIKNALSNIKSICECRLNQLYPKGIPSDIAERYHKELSHLQESSFIDDFVIFHHLSEEALKSSTFISMRGTVMGSFLYYLLGKNSFNPLPVYYYCPECGHYEKVNTRLYGMDLAQKQCPDCGSFIWADGFNLPLESVWGTNGQKHISFEYNVSKEFLPFAHRVLQTLYPENVIAPWGMFEMSHEIKSELPNERAVGINLSGYVILPKGRQIDDYPDFISYLENGDPCITGGSWELEENMLKLVRMFSLKHIENLISLQRATGIYAYEIRPVDLREITWSNLFNSTLLSSVASSFFHELRPKTFRDMVSLESSARSTFTWQQGEEKWFHDFEEMISTDSFKKYPCHTREDFFDYLVEEGFDRELAFEVSERIRKGHASTGGKNNEAFLKMPIPDEMKEVAQNYRYIFPRAHCIEYLLLYARLAYYAKRDSRAYSKIVIKKK